MSNTLVRPFFRLVANGQTKDGKHRVTLIATPESAALGSGAFPLAEWPEKMATLLAKGLAMPGSARTLKPFEVELQAAPRTQPVQVGQCWTAAAPDSAKAESFVAFAPAHKAVGASGAKAWKEVGAVWREAFEGVADAPDKEAWATLSGLLGKSLNGDSVKVDPVTQTEAPTLQGRGSIRPVEQGTAEPVTVKTIVPARQGDLAFHLEIERARRVAAEIRAAGVPATGVPLNLLQSHAVENSKTAPKEVIDGELLHRKAGELQQAIDATAEDRVKAAEEFKKQKEALASGLCADDDEADLNRRDVLEEKPAERAAAAKTQIYGSWPQAVRGGDGSSKREEQERAERIAQTFYALQGDPGFARLFCLAIDLTSDALPDFPFMFLTAEADEGGRATQRVWTAAKRTDNRFWPAPKGEIDLSEGRGDTAAQLAKLEQFDGVSLMGMGASQDAGASNPRFDLVSLDMRRGAELTGDDSVDDAGGGAKAFKTAGFIVVDRLRAREAVRAAARAAAAKEAKPVGGEKRKRAVLFAEDLTIGRRLDVAVRGKGSERWRTLMSRTVDYDFRVARRTVPSVKKTLHLLIGAPDTEARRELDDASMTFASRLVPRGSGGSEADAVVEEAITQWDGTPMAVHCGPERPVPGKLKTKTPFPFRRTLGLPDALHDPKTRPPPLRYGVGYRFSMRSTFLGGGAVALREGGEHLEAPAGAEGIRALLTFPARFSDKAPLRRFLRQEAVGRPDILLPQHIAIQSNSPMGFEQADLVVLRADNSDSALPTLIDGAPYVPAAKRARPKSTMRIVVPPSISQDEATRHGILDRASRAERAERLQGGLRDVRRDRVAPDMNNKGVLKPAGFPIAVTKKPIGWGFKPAELGREVVTSGSDTQGEAVFVAGKKQSLLPYLPDPAAEIYVLRLKNRGSGDYLEGFLCIPVYDNGPGDWPNVRPLALDISQTGARPVPTHTDEVMRLAKSPDQLLAPNGVPGKKPGARVKVVEIRLAPSEDYAFEVFCLPNADRLARWFALPETLASLANPKGSPAPFEKLVEIFGKDAASALQECLDAVAAKPERDECYCSVGGHPGPTDDLLKLVAALLIQHACGVRPIEDVAAVAGFRMACASSRPAAPPRWTAPKLPPGFDKALEAVEWISKTERRNALQLFGAPGAVRPRAITGSADKGPPYLEALSLARFVYAPKTVPGSKDFLLTGSLFLDLADADSFEIVAETSSPRSSLMDDPSRRRSLKARRAGRWPSSLDEHGARRFFSALDVYGFAEIDERERVRLQRSTLTLLRCEAIPLDGSRPLWPRWEGRAAISLAMVHQAARFGSVVIDRLANPPDPAAPAPRIMFKASQVHTFPDAKARRLTIKAVAFSRFAADWQTVDRWPATGDLSPERSLSRQRPLSREQQIRESEPTDIWLPASERPAKCVVPSPMPVFRTERYSVRKNGVLVHNVTRSAATRIYLSRSWFSSGEGERLGLVIWPPNHLDTPDLSLNQKLTAYYGHEVSLGALSDEYLGPGGAFITRWGGDPIRWDGAADGEPLIAPENFVDIPPCRSASGCPSLSPEHSRSLRHSPHNPRIVRDVLMPVAVPADENAAPSDEEGRPASEVAMMPVSLITYEPCFDVDREDWYVDIEIAQAKAADPFVRFGLVRYQEHADKTLQVSEPVVAWSQLKPTRCAAVQAVGEDDGSMTVAVCVEGPASEKVKHHRRYEKIGHPIYNALDKPQMRMTLVHERRDDAGRVWRMPVDATQGPTADSDPHIEGGKARWNLCFTVAAARLTELGPGQFYAFLEEVERRMPATYAVEPITQEQMFKVDTLVESGPQFSLRIPFEPTSVEVDAEPEQSDDTFSK